MKAKIVQDDENIVERNVLAEALMSMSDSMKSLQRGGLTFDAIVVLTQYNCKAPKKYGSKPGIADVRLVLNSLSELRERFTTLEGRGKKKR